MAGHIAALRQAIRRGMPGESSEPFSYAKILSALTSLRTARRGWAQVQSLRTRKTAPPGPAAAKRAAGPSIAQRLGLVPPAAKHLSKVYGVVRFLFQVRRELRQRNLL